jgi:hypothetical protein
MAIASSDATQEALRIPLSPALKLDSNGTFDRVIKTPSVSVTGAGKLDLDNNKLSPQPRSVRGTAPPTPALST